MAEKATKSGKSSKKLKSLPVQAVPVKLAKNVRGGKEKYMVIKMEEVKITSV